MTPAQINAAIATWMGWTDISPTFHVGFDPDSGQPRPIPNYHGDLNACADFEAHLADNYESYVDSLFNVHHRDGEVLGVVSCSAPQRCEALLRTLNLWREE